MLRTMTKVVGSFSQASSRYKGERCSVLCARKDAKRNFRGRVAEGALVEQFLRNWEAWW
jgi:hypothetical protein